MSSPISFAGGWMNRILPRRCTLDSFPTKRWHSLCGSFVSPDSATKLFTTAFPNISFIYFIAGALAAVLVLASVIEPELVLYFEITPHRTVLFYLTVFTGILATARGMIPEENFVFDPEVLMMDVIHYTHYMPTEWKGQLHSQSASS